MRRSRKQRVAALGMAALTACYTTSTYRFEHETVQATWPRSQGDRVHVLTAPPQGAAESVALFEEPLCRDVERVQVVHMTAYRSSKQSLQGGGLGAPFLGGAATLVFLAIAIPLVIVVAIVHAAAPDTTYREEPAPVPRETRLRWAGPTAPCGAPVRSAPGVSLLLATPAGAPRLECLTWTVTTGPDGAVWLDAALDPLTAVLAACPGPAAPGCLRVESPEATDEPPLAPEAPDDVPPPRRTYPPVAAVIPAAIRARLGLPDPVNGSCEVGVLPRGPSMEDPGEERPAPEAPSAPPSLARVGAILPP